MRKWIMAAAFGLAANIAPVAAAPADPWSDLIVFGDSLSDPGNILPGLTFTNGETWAQQLGATRFAGGGTNYAIGNARAVSNLGTGPGQDLFLDFPEQRAIFDLVNPALGADPLVVAWFGGNDLLNASDASAVPNAIIAIATGVVELAVGSGLTRFILPGLPDLGRIPANLGTVGAPLATAATEAFNGALRTFAESGAAFGLDITYLDIDAIFDDILDRPGDFGFTDTTGTCLSGLVDCTGFVFWDDIHPTRATHTLIAEAVRAAATAPAPIPLPAGLWLLLGGVGGIALIGRGRRKVAA